MYLQKYIIFIFLILPVFAFSQQNRISVEGTVQDTSQMPIPYVSVYIPSKQIGTTTTEEGQFYLALEQSNLKDILMISSLGYKTFQIKVEDYLNQKNKTIVLEEDVMSLETVEIINLKAYIPKVLKQMKENFVSSNHQLDMVYRRTTVQQNVSKFFVEHYMSILYKGPNSSVSRLQVKEARKSADYRIVKEPQWNHAAVYMINLNPLNDYYTPLRRMDWKKIGNTTYDGEDVLILEGTKENVEKVGKRLTTVLYVGFETNNIYKVESSAGRCVYQYVKNSEGKLYLSYHKREYTGRNKISPLEQKILKLKTPYISHAYRHEAFVLGIKTDKDKFTTKGYEEHDKELSEISLPYNPTFWKNLSLPPDTEFYKKIKRELESNYGVPLETQFKLVN